VWLEDAEEDQKKTLCSLFPKRPIHGKLKIDSANKGFSLKSRSEREMAVDSRGGGGAKMQRVDEQGDLRESVGADEDRLSALPDDLRQRILTHLALKDVIRTGVVARGWRYITEPLNLAGFQKSWLAFPMGCNMTSEQKTKVDALEQEIRPQIPLYITAMDMTSVCRILVSSEFILCSQGDLFSIVLLFFETFTLAYLTC
jgi:hypothetical protein